MAFRSSKRKDIKKSSYYVWFLGAKESAGLRGEEYIRPVVHYLLKKERDLEPMKVTLQISNKGLKIVQSVLKKNNKNKTETLKHFIPHHAITCCMQGYEPYDDLVSCILLIFNPVTKCPVHVHTYRCDSVETAGILRKQLQVLIDRSENQNKFKELENRLFAKGLLISKCLPPNTDLAVTPASSDSSTSSLEREIRSEQTTTLYNSLTAELKEKLTSKETGPILLPPKDYDTIVRRHGKIDQHPLHKPPINETVIFEKQITRYHYGPYGERESSGIGSDETSSPERIIQAINGLDIARDERDWSSSNDEDYPNEDDNRLLFQTAWKKSPQEKWVGDSPRRPNSLGFFSSSQTRSKNNLDYSEDLGYNSPSPKREYLFGENPLSNLDVDRSRPRSYLDLISPERIFRSKEESSAKSYYRPISTPDYKLSGKKDNNTPEPYLYNLRDTCVYPIGTTTEPLNRPKSYLYTQDFPPRLLERSYH